MKLVSILSALSMFAAFVYVFIGFYTFLENRKSTIHRAFLLLCMSMAIWSFAYSFAYIAENGFVFSFWNKISAIGWCSFSAITLYLVLLITENKFVRKPVVCILIFLPAVVFLYMALFLFGEGVKTSKMVSDIFYTGDFLYNFSFLLISILLIMVWGIRNNNTRIRLQAKLLVLSSLVPFLLNLLTQTLLPMFIDVRFPLMGQIYGVVMISGVYIVISRYKFMRLPESYITEEISSEMLDMVVIIDGNGDILRISQHTLNVLGFEKQEVMKKNIEFMIDKKDIAKVSVRELKESNLRINDINLVKKNGDRLPVNISAKRIIDGSVHDLIGIIMIIQDISLLHELERKNSELQAYVEQLMATEDELRLQYNQRIESEERLRISEEKFRKIFEQAPMGIILSDSRTGRFLDANPKAIEIHGRQLSELLDTDWICLSHKDDIEENLKKLDLLNEKKISNFNMNKRFIKLDGSYVWTNITVVSFGNDEASNPVDICIMEDISEKMERQSQIEFLSYHDQLTGLYNRRYFEEELVRIDSEENLPLGIIMADVNGLKLINDSFGHALGDELLIKAAKIMKLHCKSDDIISRMGGDEFIIIMPKTGKQEIENIIAEISKSADNESVGSLSVSIAFGYEIKYNKNELIHEILKKAEDYMYNDKLMKSPEVKKNAINKIIASIFENNPKEELHANFVSKICDRFGKALEFQDNERYTLKMAGRLHDIGKIALNSVNLEKPGKLSAYEWEEVKRHSEIGYRILSSVNDMAEMGSYVLSHHERWDGTGYPRNLKEQEILIQSRIITIADAYAAMTNESTYKATLSKEEAIQELRRNAGLQFDPTLVDIFIEKVVDGL